MAQKRYSTKKLYLFLVCHIIVLLFFYLFGPQGLPVINHLKQEVLAQKDEITKASQEINELTVALQEWYAHDFYKEKIAREQLQMARDGETIYFLTTKEYEDV